MVNYANSKVYRLVCNITKKEYIGSTTDKLNRRLSKHRSDYKNYIDGKNKYISSFEILENDNYSIVLIENFACNSKEELLQRERYFIENTDCVNYRLPIKTDEEYKEYYKEYEKSDICKKRRKEHRQKNVEHYTEYTKQYRASNKEKIKQYYEDNKEKLAEKKKDYWTKNKEILKEKSKAYREKNKEKIIQKRKENYENNKQKIMKEVAEFRNKNKDEINRRQREYWEKNKDEINRKRREKRKEKL